MARRRTRRRRAAGAGSPRGRRPRARRPRRLRGAAIATYRDEALILRKLDYGEADRILTLLTREHGKVGVIAKGVRRQASRLGPVLEVFTHVDVQLARGRNLDVVTQAVRLPGPRFPADVERTARAALVCELADRVAEDRHPAPDVFKLTAEGLHELAVEPDPRRATSRFLFGALAELGYGPRLHECASCDRPLPAAPAPFAPEAGGFLCPDCARPGMHPVPVGAVKVLRVLEAGDIPLYRRLKLEDELLAEVELILEAQLEHHLDRQLRSLRFLRQMRTPS